MARPTPMLPQHMADQCDMPSQRTPIHEAVTSPKAGTKLKPPLHREDVRQTRYGSKEA